MDSPLKCFNQALSSRLSSQCSNNELLGYLLTTLYYSDCKIRPPLHINVAHFHIKTWIDTQVQREPKLESEWDKLRVLVLEIFLRLQRAGFNWVYSQLSIYPSSKISSIMDHSIGLSEEAGCLYTGEDRVGNIFSGNGR